MMINGYQKLTGYGQRAAHFMGLSAPLPRDLVHQALFASGPGLPTSDASLLSGYATNSVYVISDYTTVFRSAQDLANSIWTAFPKTVPTNWMKLLHGSDMLIGYHAFGSLTGVNAILGFFAARGGFRQIVYAEAIDDRRGVLKGRLSVVQGGALMGAGISFGAFRPLAVARELIDPSKAAHLTQFSKIAGLAGSGFYNLFFVALAANFGLNAYEASQFLKTLKKAETLEEKMSVLEAMKTKPLASTKPFRDIALETASVKLKQLCKELKLPIPSDSKRKEMILLLLRQDTLAWSEEGLSRSVEHQLSELGKKIVQDKQVLHFEAKMQRVLSRKGLRAWQELSRDEVLHAGIRKGEVTAIKRGNHLMAQIEKAARREFFEKGFVVGVCILELLAITLSLVLTGGIPLIASAAVMLVASLFMMSVDVYYLIDTYKNELPATHDKRILILSTVIALISLSIVIGVAASGWMTFVSLPVITALILSTLWGGQNGITYAVMQRNERINNEKNPTLESFLKECEKGAANERLEKLLERLPSDIRKKIEGNRDWLGQNLREAAKAVALRVEEAKKQRFEAMQEALAI